MSVDALISDARGYADSTIKSATSALQDARSMVAAVGYVVPNFTPVALPSAPPSSVGIELPALQDVTLTLPGEPAAAPVFQDISAVEAGAVPTLAASAPALALPTAPSQLAAFLEAAPGIDTAIVFPSPPDVLMNPLIEAPVLQERDAPAAPQVSLPVFGALAPIDTTQAPADLEDRFSAAWREAAPSTISMMDGYVDAMLARHCPRYHEQMARIEDQLAIYLDGGTGLKPAVEDAIYERARGKNDAEARRVRDTAYGEAASRGFTLPPGSLLAALQRARQAGADNNATAAREIVVMQAEMEQKNLQFAVTTSAALRGTLLNAALSYHQNLVGINGQALDYAKSVLSAIIETYNTAVRAFEVKLDTYKAEAVVFETRLKSAMAGVELYKAEIDALLALSNVDRAKVDVYRARIDALNSMAGVYRAQIDAVAGRASLEKLKLDVFQAKVQAYSAQVQGKNAEWQGYTAAIGGETAKAQLFRTQVDAFGAQVQGYKAGIEAKSEVVRASALTNKARADQYAAVLSGYSAVVQAKGEVARTQLENQRQTIVAFQAKVQATVANAQVQSEYYRSASLVGIENARLRMTTQIQGAESTRSFGQSIAQLGIASAGVYQHLASAAMSGMNTLSAETKGE